MIIGIPKEIKNNENRVAITPAGALTLTLAGHAVLVEKNAGLGSGFKDEDYEAAGAKTIADAETVWQSSDMIMKVKEPLESEFGYFRENLILFTYLHLAAEPALAAALKRSKVAAIAYEMVKENGTLPLLAPMSEVAGRMSIQIGAQFLQRNSGGQGILLSGVPGVNKGNVCIIGGGIVGTNAAQLAIGLGADVTVIDLSVERLRQLEHLFGNRINTLVSNPYNIAEAVAKADLVVGAVLIPGAKAPKLVTEEMVKRMKPGSVIVDVAIDQGGIVETIDRTTTHDDPVFVKHDILHYSVPNMPGSVPKTSTSALTNVTIPYALQIAGKGFERAVRENAAISSGVNVCNGVITSPAVAQAFGESSVSVEEALAR